MAACMNARSPDAPFLYRKQEFPQAASFFPPLLEKQGKILFFFSSLSLSSESWRVPSMNLDISSQHECVYYLSICVCVDFFDKPALYFLLHLSGSPNYSGTRCNSGS